MHIFSLPVTVWYDISPKEEARDLKSDTFQSTLFNLVGSFGPLIFYGCGLQLLLSSQVHGTKKTPNKCLLNEMIDEWEKKKKSPRSWNYKEKEKRKEINILSNSHIINILSNSHIHLYLDIDIDIYRHIQI